MCVKCWGEELCQCLYVHASFCVVFKNTDIKSMSKGDVIMRCARGTRGEVCGEAGSTLK